jgi:DNA-binding response OmpR family regulator
MAFQKRYSIVGMEPPRILVVDDEISVRKLVSRLLLQEGFDVLTASSGGEGLKLIEKQKPALVILDFDLPDITGDKVYQMVRQNPRTQSLPILIMTGLATKGLSSRCLNEGADAYLAKPFDPDDLCANVRALLRRSTAYVSEDSVIQRGALIIKLLERQVIFDGRAIQRLAPKEFELLKQLALRSPAIVDASTLAAQVWNVPVEELPLRTLDVHIRRVRRKLGPAGGALLQNVPSIGYQWIDKSPS